METGAGAEEVVAVAMRSKKIVIDMSCFFLTRIIKAVECSEDAVEATCQSVARISNKIDPHGDVIIAAQDLSPDADQPWQCRLDDGYRPKIQSFSRDSISVSGQIMNAVETMGIPVVNVPGSEADDVASILAQHYAFKGERVAVVSSDPKLAHLLATDRIELWEPFGGRRNIPWCFRRFGVPPRFVPDVLALTGSPRFDGVAGIGPKRATMLVLQHEGIENILCLANPETMERKVIDDGYRVAINKVMATPRMNG